MATFQQGNVLSRKAGVDLSALTKQYTIVKLDANGLIVPAASATDRIVGVLATVGILGDVVSFFARNASGSFKVRLAGTVAVGDYITSDANGLGIATTTAGNQIVGQAMETGVSGQVIEVLIMNRTGLGRI